MKAKGEAWEKFKRENIPHDEQNQKHFMRLIEKAFNEGYAAGKKRKRKGKQ